MSGGSEGGGWRPAHSWWLKHVGPRGSDRCRFEILQTEMKISNVMSDGYILRNEF